MPSQQIHTKKSFADLPQDIVGYIGGQCGTALPEEMNTQPFLINNEDLASGMIKYSVIRYLNDIDTRNSIDTTSLLQFCQSALLSKYANTVSADCLKLLNKLRHSLYNFEHEALHHALTLLAQDYQSEAEKTAKLDQPITTKILADSKVSPIARALVSVLWYRSTKSEDKSVRETFIEFSSVQPDLFPILTREERKLCIQHLLSAGSAAQVLAVSRYCTIDDLMALCCRLNQSTRVDMQTVLPGQYLVDIIRRLEINASLAPYISFITKSLLSNAAFRFTAIQIQSAVRLLLSHNVPNATTLAALLVNYNHFTNSQDIETLRTTLQQASVQQRQEILEIAKLEPTKHATLLHSLSPLSSDEAESIIDGQSERKIADKVMLWQTRLTCPTLDANEQDIAIDTILDLRQKRKVKLSPVKWSRWQFTSSTLQRLYHLMDHRLQQMTKATKQQELADKWDISNLLFQRWRQDGFDSLPITDDTYKLAHPILQPKCLRLPEMGSRHDEDSSQLGSIFIDLINHAEEDDVEMITAVILNALQRTTFIQKEDGREVVKSHSILSPSSDTTESEKFTLYVLWTIVETTINYAMPKPISLHFAPYTVEIYPTKTTQKITESIACSGVLQHPHLRDILSKALSHLYSIYTANKDPLQFVKPFQLVNKLYQHFSWIPNATIDRSLDEYTKQYLHQDSHIPTAFSIEVYRRFNINSTEDFEAPFVKKMQLRWRTSIFPESSAFHCLLRCLAHSPTDSQSTEMTSRFFAILRNQLSQRPYLIYNEMLPDLILILSRRRGTRIFLTDQIACINRGLTAQEPGLVQNYRSMATACLFAAPIEERENLQRRLAGYLS